MTRRAWCSWTMCALAVLPAACSKLGEKPVPAPAPPAVTNVATPAVASMKPAEIERPKLPESVATISAAEEIAVKAPKTGYIVRQVYKAGAMVAAGDVLFLLDPRTTHDEWTTDKSALVRVVSPVAGVPGEAWHGAGDWVDPNMELVGVGEIDGVDAEVNVTAALARQITDYEQTSPASRQPAKDFELILPDGTLYPERGSIQTQTIPSGGGDVNTLSIYFPNPGHILRPGEFVKVRSAGP